MDQRKFSVVKVLNPAPEFSLPITVAQSFLFQIQGSKSFYTRYMDPPLNEDDRLAMDSFVKSYAEPPSTWNGFECQILFSTSMNNYYFISFTSELINKHTPTDTFSHL